MQTQLIAHTPARRTRPAAAAFGALVAATALLAGPATPAESRTRCAKDRSAPQGLTYGAVGWARGKLTVINRGDEDAVVQLVAGGRTVFATYVRQFSTWTAGGVPDGYYTLYYTRGVDWNYTPGMFSCRGGSWRLTRGLGYRSGSHWQVTITAMRGGNTNSVPAKPPPLR